jgi:cysteine desulfurase
VKLSLPPLGTPAVPLIAGFAKALEIAARDREREFKRLDYLSTMFVRMLKQNLPQAEIVRTAPNLVNISIPNMLPEFMVLKLDREGIQVSAGPACNSNKPEPRDTPVRFSFGRFTTESDVKRAVEIFCCTVTNMVK